MFKHFSGRIIQVANALSYRDGVSNQIIRMHKLFLELGLNASISTLHADSRCEIMPTPLDELIATAADIIFFHHSGYAPALENVLKQRCCKIYVYHNITPPDFFAENSELHALCQRGIAQLPSIIDQFDYYLGDSEFNLSSLFELGLTKNQTTVFPIIIDPPKVSLSTQPSTEKKSWIYIGRFAENKRQVQLVQFFQQFIQQYGDDHELLLAGNTEQNPVYTQQVEAIINQLNISDRVKILGTVSDAELEKLYAKASLYVSLSQHEGFGIPLIEACHYDIPVFALNHGAVAEVLQNSLGLATDENELLVKIANYFEDVGFREPLLTHQEKLKVYYASYSATTRMQTILEKFIPKPTQFKTVSIVICTYNRADLLARCLDYLQYQTCSNFEVIVINGPSTDNTLEVINQYKNSIKFNQNPAKNLSISRNLGIALATGDIIGFIDDDALPFDHWVETILKTYNSIPVRVAAVGGSTYYAGTLEFQACDDAADTFAYGTQNCTAATFLDANKLRITLGTNATFKRADLIAINGFDEQYDYFLDETDVCFRLQRDHHKFIHYQADLYLRHEFAQSGNRLSKHAFNWFSICKNIAYFIIKFNPNLSADIHLEKIEEHLDAIYYARIKHAYSHEEISYEELCKHFESINKGMQQGIADAKNPKKLGSFLTNPDAFKPYNRLFYDPIKYSRSLHIVILTEEFGHFTNAGGTGTLYYQLASELLQMGNQVSVVIPTKDASLNYIRGNFALYKINLTSHLPETDNATFMGNMNKAITATRFIQHLHEKQPVDIIDYSLWNTLGLTLRLSPALQKITTVVRLVSPFKVVASINQWKFTDDEMELMLESERHLIKNSSFVIPISQSIEKTMLEDYGLVKNQRWKYCPAGIAYWPTFDFNSGYNALTIENSNLLNISHQTKKILFVGRLEARKGIETLLNAVTILLDKNADSDVIFIIAGKDTEQFQEKFLQTTPINHNKKVIFLGEIESSVKEKLYLFCDVLVFPSLYESFGLVPLEAFVHGKPVIAARAAAIPEVVQDKINGLLFEAGNAAELAGTIERLIHNPVLYDVLSKGALHRIRELSSRNMALKSFEIYLEAFKEKVYE